MKKNRKISTLAIATISSLALIATGTLAWYFTSRQSNAVQVDTAKIEITEVVVTPETIDQPLPGETYKINDSQSEITNVGTRNAILEVSVKDGDMKGTIKGLVGVDGSKVADLPPATSAADYDGLNYRIKRLREVVKWDFADISSNAAWVKIPAGDPLDKDFMDRFYYFLKVGETVDLGLIEVTFDGELGGGRLSGAGTSAVTSPSRQYEQASNFKLAFTVRAVQPTRAAVVDHYGITDSRLPDGFYETRKP